MNGAGAKPTHHPPEALLVDYASGAASEAQALLIACHVGWCAECRRMVDEAEAIGGALLGMIEPAPMAPSALNRALAALDRLPPESQEPAGGAIHVPAPLLPYVGPDSGRVRWRRLVAGFAECELSRDPSSRLSLLKAPSGRAALEHEHLGEEWTVVLQGSFSDGTSLYRAGDFAVAADRTRHVLRAGTEEDCVCLVLAHGGMRYTGLLGALMQPLLAR